MNFGRLRVQPGDPKPLDREATNFTGKFDGKESAQKYLAERLQRLAAMQETFAAERRHALLVVLQGMDTAGKDSAIKHVFSGLNPETICVSNFKQPSTEELSHDFLWRAVRALPSRGHIGVFNRSYYEEVLVVRVHPELLEAQQLPRERMSPRMWEERFEDINTFERHLWRSGTIVTKFFLNISRREQERRLLERIKDPSKHWKFSAGDLPERAKWKSYMGAYEDALAATSTERAPWYVIPSDHKWFAHAAIAEILCQTLSDLQLRLPPLTSAVRRELKEAEAQLTPKHSRRS
jgi:PPK2 family polyphosphate:nucleotide phosphotransferase